MTEPFLTINNSEANNENGAPEQEQVKRIELREDYYAMTWCGFQKYYQDKLCMPREFLFSHFTKCLMICSIQMLLVILVYLSLTDVKLSKEVPWDLVLIRFFCVALLHI